MQDTQEKIQMPELVELMTFTVTCEGVTYEQYRRILEICPSAECQKEW